MNERDTLLRNLSALAFTLYDLQLYLDTHPYDMAALAHYTQHRQQYLQAAALYEQKYGPLTALNGASANTWKWIKDPWPWEYAANTEVN